jgi:uncharacterized membrane protein YbaN (DUF454 family)
VGKELNKDLKRIIFACIGSVATLVAVLGVWLPGVPTTMPLLIALWAFSKSSARLERALERVPLLRHALLEARRFERERSIAWQVKLVAQVSAWTSAVVVGLLTRSLTIAVILGMVAVSCTIFMIYIPTRKKTAIADNIQAIPSRKS